MAMAEEPHLTESETAPLYALLKKSADGIVIVDGDGTILFVNPAAAEIFGRSEEALTGSGLGLPLSSGEKTVVEILNQDRTLRTVQMIATETLWYERPVYLAIFHDITREIEAEEKYRLLAENTSDLIVVCENGEISYVSPSVSAVLGYSADEFEALGYLGTVHPDYTDELSNTMGRDLFASPSGHVHFLCKHLHADGTYHWLETNGASRILDPGKTVTVLNSRDVSERVETKRELERAVDQKNFLMRELNHRVKNNLALVTSLIDTKESTMDGEVDLSDLTSRIDAIRIVHEKLYETEEVTHINIRDYVDDLLNTVFSSLSSRGVEVINEVESVFIPTKTAIPLGLIINEVATNAIKHGYANEPSPRFIAKMSAVTPPAGGGAAEAVREAGAGGGGAEAVRGAAGGYTYVLTLSSNGAAIPEEIDIEGTSSLGLKLTSLLTQQIGGTLHLQRGPEPTFTIQFS